MKLPQSTTTRDLAGLKCPWCLAYVEDVTVTLESLRWAYESRHLTRVVSPEGRPECQALTAHCPDCSRPFVIKFSEFTDYSGTEYFVRLMPIRTEKDFRLLSGSTQVVA